MSAPSQGFTALFPEMRSWALTGDDLDDSCFLHVGWKVASSHVLLHDPDVGQLLQKPHRRVSSQGRSGGTQHTLHSQGSAVTLLAKTHREPAATPLSWL